MPSLEMKEDSNASLGSAPSESGRAQGGRFEESQNLVGPKGIEIQASLILSGGRSEERGNWPSEASRKSGGGR